MAYASITYTSASGTTFALTNSSGDPIEYIKQNDSTLTAADLNNASNQNLYALQEFRDSYGAFVGGTDLASNTAIIASTETWISDDSHWATTAAADARTDSKVAANNSVVQGYATAAASSASAASTSASNAATSASNAATSASNAVTAQTAAEAARDQTLAAYDNFDDRYLGTKTSDPTLDNDGNALVAGALYFNSVAGEMRLWTGTAWVAAYVSGSGFLALTGGTMTGALGVTAGTAGSPSISISGDTNTGIYSPSADRVAISTGGLGRLFVVENGNVGIGLEAPQKKASCCRRLK
jgi:hypothetical protein